MPRRPLVGLLLLPLAAALVLVPRPQAAGAATCGRPQQRVDAALASLHFPWRRLGFHYLAEPARTDGTLGLTFQGPKRTELYVQPCAQESDALLRHVVAHEVGHAIALSWTTSAQHRQWDAARGLPKGTPWFACDRCPVWDSAEGDFVEVFAYWQTGEFRSAISQPPTRAQLRRLVKLIPKA